MKNGPARFEHYLVQLEKLISDSQQQKDPALWLYQNNARTPIFMIEGLAKLYGGINNKKRFEKIETHFKLLEDALGAIDYYDGFAKQFETDKKVSAAITGKIRAKSLEKAKTLDEILEKKHWIGKGANRIEKIRRELKGADWLGEKDEVKNIQSFYRKSIDKINAFAKTYRAGFTELESQVHELRRKLRWLSIYPQALQGCIQLTTNPASDPNVDKYLTPEIVNSPFNKMPAAGSNGHLLILNRDYFFALSWMISELGKLKDEGLRLVVLDEAGGNSKAGAATNASILSRASEISQKYFADGNLDKLVKGIVRSPA